MRIDRDVPVDAVTNVHLPNGNIRSLSLPTGCTIVLPYPHIAMRVGDMIGNNRIVELKRKRRFTVYTV